MVFVFCLFNQSSRCKKEIDFLKTLYVHSAEKKDNSCGINYFNIWFNLCYLSRNYKLANSKFSFLNLKFQFLF